jgi:apolipoprotein N-acyltransferase
MEIGEAYSTRADPRNAFFQQGLLRPKRPGGASLAGSGVVRYASTPRDVQPALLTLATALLFGLSFPPVGAAPLAWVALVPFLVALARVPPRRAAALALLLAPAGALGITWWFPWTVSAYFGTGVLLGGLAWLVFCTLSVGLQLVPFAVWTSWMARRGAAAPLLIAAAWAACEFLRARIWSAIQGSRLFLMSGCRQCSS